MTTLDTFDPSTDMVPMDEPPLWMQGGVYPAGADRSLITAALPTAGVLNKGLRVSPRAEGANMSVDVAAGSAVVAGTDAPDQGNYLCRALERTNIAIPPAPGAGLSRRDLVIARVYDDSLIGGGVNEWRLEVVSGVAAAAPADPALPPSALVLALVTVPSGLAAVVAGNITDRRAPAGSGFVGTAPPDQRVEMHLMAGQTTKRTDGFSVIEFALPVGARLVSGHATYIGYGVVGMFLRDVRPGAVCAFHAVYSDSGNNMGNNVDVRVDYQIWYTFDPDYVPGVFEEEPAQHE